MSNSASLLRSKQVPMTRDHFPCNRYCTVCCNQKQANTNRVPVKRSKTCTGLPTATLIHQILSTQSSCVEWTEMFLTLIALVANEVCERALKRSYQVYVQCCYSEPSLQFSSVATQGALALMALGSMHKIQHLLRNPECIARVLQLEMLTSLSIGELG